MKNLPYWTKRDKSHRQKYGPWNPTKKLNRQRLQDMKNIAEMAPHLRTIDLANMFKVSPEAVRRILKSQWVPNEVDEDKLVQRMERKRSQIREARQHQTRNEQRPTLAVKVLDFNKEPKAPKQRNKAPKRHRVLDISDMID